MVSPPTIIFDSHAISGITGAISIACWIIVFAPQIYENFSRKSSEGLSLLFIVLWLAGDVFNVLGAVLQGVLPTMTILAIYYTLADIVLLWQCLVYGDSSTKIDPIHLSPANPLTSDTTNENYNSIARESYSDEESLESIESNISRFKSLLYNLLMVGLVLLAGITGWYISNLKQGNNHPDKPKDELHFDPLAQFFGWLCAFLYLGSRVPQILLNFKRKSCDGISFMFFLFACLGNLTYVMSILSVDLSYNYLLVNSSWLTGSFGTLALDFTIFIQFFMYNQKSTKVLSQNYGSVQE